MPQTQLTSYFVDKFNAPKSGFIISDGDNHYPIHDKRVEAAKLALAQDLKPYLWVNVGDQYDFWGLSRFEKEPSRLFGGAATLQKEFDSAGAYWDEVCNVTDRVHFILGNHENRLAKLISTNPALYDMQSLAWEVMASLPDNVTVHPYGTRIRLNNIPLGFEHGDQIGSSRGVKHPSAWLLDNKGDRNTIYGHVHRMEIKNKTTWDEFGKASHYTAIGQGCGVDFSKVWTWAPEPNWQHGFTVIEVYTVGGKPFFTAHPIQVINGRFSFGGKVYDGR